VWLSVLVLLGRLAAFLHLLAVVVVLGSALLARCGRNVEHGLLLVLWLELLFYYFWLSAAGVRTSTRVALGRAEVGTLATSGLFLCFCFLVVVGVFSLVATAVTDSSEALGVIAGRGASLAEPVVAIDLLEL